MKETYRMQVPAKKGAGATALTLISVLIICTLLLKAVTFLPFGWAFQIAVILLCAIYINKLLKQGTFSVTYVLYENSLQVHTRYGFITSVSATYILDETAFTESTVTYKGKTHPFYPDENLKKLLNI